MRVLVCLLLAAGAALGAYDPLRIGGSWLIQGYKRVLSPLQGGNVCNFSPTCSQFTEGAINRAGFLPGVVMGADRLMRCNSCAWSQAGQSYLSVTKNRLSDPVGRHLAWSDPPLPAEPTTISASPLSPSPPDHDTDPFGVAFADRLYESGAFTEAATEYLRLRFLARSAGVRAYAGLMAGESYLAGSAFESARRAFATAADTHAVQFSRYGTARAWFAEGRFSDAARTLESLPPGPLRVSDRVLQAWSRFKQGDFRLGAELMANAGPDSLCRELAGLDGRGIRRRSRLTSTLFSALIPGLGQLYSGRAGDAAYAFVTVGALGAVTGWFIANPGRDPGRIKLSIFGALTALFHAGNIYGASIAARDYNQLQMRRYISTADDLFHRFDLVPDYRFLLDEASGAGALQPGI